MPSMTVGGVQVYGLSDGTLPTGLDKIVDMGRTQALQLVGETDDNGVFPIPVNNFVIRRGDKVIMIDAGAGNTMQPTLGKLPENLRKGGIDPDHGVKAIYAGSHTASFEALRNHKVEAGELNSEEIASAQLHNEYDPSAYVTLWKSGPIPQDPFAVRSDLPADFKTRLAHVLQTLDFHELPEADQKFLAANEGKALRTVPQNDHAYDQIRDLVSTLHIDLSKL